MSGFDNLNFDLSVGERPLEVFREIVRPYFLDSSFSVQRNSEAWGFLNGSLVSFPANTPRWVERPGVKAGLLVERARTNYVRNSRVEGAVVGTPGTAPTLWSGWTGTFNGVAVSIAGTGLDDGIPCVDVSLTGTATQTTILKWFFDSLAPLAYGGEAWTCSAFVKAISGNWTPLLLQLVQQIEDASANVVGSYLSPLFVANSLRFSENRIHITEIIEGGSAVYNRPGIRLEIPIGTVVAATFRIGAPQLEKGGLTSPILSVAGTPAARTRAADSLSVTSPSWLKSAEGTFAAEVLLNSPKSELSSRSIFELSNTTETILSAFCISGLNHDPIYAIPNPHLQSIKVAAGYSFASEGAGSVVEGTALVLFTPPSEVFGPFTLRLGKSSIPDEELNGTILGFRYFPKRLTDFETHRITV